MRNFTFLYVLLLSTPTAFSQPSEKIWFNKTDSVYGYYVVIPPASSPRIQAALVLLDGYSGNADGFFPETKIQNVAYANEILTVCIPTGTRLYADSSMLALLNRSLSEVAARYHLRKDQFAIGGFSSGGTIALRYAELCHENPAQFAVLPQAVFDVDSPTDLVELYMSSERELKKDFKGWWLGESQMIIDRFNKELGPLPVTKKYSEVSPFMGNTEGAGNEQWLKQTAVRSYHDVDVNWFIQNRRRSLYETNMLSASRFINQLVLEGNSQAEFVSSKIQGHRVNGQRHPHSWNIVDEIDLIQWIREKLHFYPDHIEKPYSYKAPQNWQPETIPFPMDFAPTLPYKGFEDLRFAPGWGKTDSDEKWLYTFLWWLDGSHSFTEKTLVRDLETYFTGLTRDKGVADKLDMSHWTPAKAQVQKVTTVSGDAGTYTATVNIFDTEVTMKPAVLFIKIHVKKTTDKNRTIVLFEIAASPFSASIWGQADKINDQLNEPE